MLRARCSPVGERSGDGSNDALANPMAMNESDLKVGAVYETASRQLRRVLRLTPRHVLYEIRTPSPPFYRVSVLRRKFAAEAMRVHGTPNDLPPTGPPSKRDGNARAWRS
jgi:hypothetical protein